MNLLKWISLPAILFLLVAIVGCGDGGPKRYDVSGSVTFKGQPVKEGRIVFEPVDKTKGNGGHASIIDGKYDTKTGGKGHLGGPHKITITGFGTELVKKGDPDSGPKPLFPTYVIESQDLKTETEVDFEVPGK